MSTRCAGGKASFMVPPWACTTVKKPVNVSCATHVAWKSYSKGLPPAFRSGAHCVAASHGMAACCTCPACLERFLQKAGNLLQAQTHQKLDAAMSLLASVIASSISRPKTSSAAHHLRASGLWSYSRGAHILFFFLSMRRTQH